MADASNIRAAKTKFALVESDGWTTTVTFENGTTAKAVPHPDQPHYSVIAHRCGYGDDLAAYCFEHEVFHLLVEEWFHARPSNVLKHVANGKMLSGQESASEELMAQTCQRWVRANERPIIGGVDWDAFKSNALAVLDGGK